MKVYNKFNLRGQVWNVWTSRRKTSMKHFIAACVVVVLLPIAGWAQNQGYELRVGRLVVSKTNWDAASTADFQVQVKRRDPAVEKKINALDKRIGQFRDEVEKLKSQSGPLQQKEAQSKIEPGPPLTDPELKTRAVLAGMALEEMTKALGAELRRINQKEEESKREPGPPLTPEEEAQLQSLADRLSDVQGDLQKSVSERNFNRALIYGRTRTLDSDSRTLDFDSQRILTVYAGDVLQVTAVDEDFFNDDVIGRHAIHLSDQILAEGSIDLGHADFIRALELHFTPIQ